MESTQKLLNIENLQEMMSSKCWVDVILLTQSAFDSKRAPWALFFRAAAFQELEKLTEAIEAVETGLTLSPDDEWGQAIRFEVLLKLKREDEAFLLLREHLLCSNESNGDIESIRAHYVKCAAEYGRFDFAGEINETRAVIKKSKMQARYAVALQCFNKADTLDQVLQHLVKCYDTRRFGLVIIQDSAIGSDRQDIYLPATEKVKAVLADWLPRLMQAFESVEICENSDNRGTAPTCRSLLDHVANRFDGFVFIEDDCLLAPDALQWVSHHLELNIKLSGYWFSTCESIFFDGRTCAPPENSYDIISKYANLSHVRSAYVSLKFVPSTCFITSSEIWAICSNIRSFTRGPESLTKFMSYMPNKILAPVVPRAADVGMLHDFGYSVGMLGKNNVKEQKKTYIMSAGPLNKNKVCYFSDNESILFAASVLFEEEALADIASKTLVHMMNHDE